MDPTHKSINLENSTMYANNNLNAIPVSTPTDADGFVRVALSVTTPKAREEAIQRHAEKAGVSTAKIRLV